MKEYRIYDEKNQCFIEGVSFTKRSEANRFCDVLEAKHKTDFYPIMFIDGIQVTRI